MSDRMNQLDQLKVPPKNCLVYLQDSVIYFFFSQCCNTSFVKICLQPCHYLFCNTLLLKTPLKFHKKCDFFRDRVVYIQTFLMQVYDNHVFEK